jgi:hypothetical protein
MEDFKNRLEEAQVDVELMDADSPSGIGMAESYDILGRPAVALIREDGSPVQVWQGEDSLPAVSEVSYMSHQ